MKSNLPFISVVVPAFNEEKYLEASLISLKSQDYPKERFEIIVEVSGSTDRTAEVARRHGVKVVDYGKRLGVSGARQAGSVVAAGEIIAGTDADTVHPSHWLAVISETLSSGEHVGVTGPVRVQSGKLWSRLSYTFAYGLYRLIGLAHFGEVYFPGMNFAIRREVFDKIGGFNAELMAGEDTDLSIKAAKHGKLKFDRRMTVYTQPRRLKEGPFKSYWRYTRTFIAVRYRRGTAPGFEDFR